MDVIKQAFQVVYIKYLSIIIYASIGSNVKSYYIHQEMHLLMLYFKLQILYM